MANRSKKITPPRKRFEPSVPLLILLAFALGAGMTWFIMRVSSSTSPPKPAIETFLPPSMTAQPSGSSSFPMSAPAEPPDVSQLAPVDAARTLANWNYDRQSWQHAIEHYQQAIALGADIPDVRTDLGNCYRFLGQPEKALEQYQVAQKENPQHENSLFNQISLYGEILHDNERADAVARDFLARFPQSAKAESVRKRLQSPEGGFSPK